MVSSLWRFHDQTQLHTMLCKTPLVEGSASLRDLITDNQQHSQETEIQTHNQRKRGATDPRLDRAVNGICKIIIK